MINRWERRNFRLNGRSGIFKVYNSGESNDMTLGRMFIVICMLLSLLVDKYKDLIRAHF